MAGLIHPSRSGHAGRKVFARFAIALLLAFALLPEVTGPRFIVINTSPSVSPGIYVRSSAVPAVGRVVDFRIPLAARRYVQLRSGHSGQEWFILKSIVAGPGDRLDTTLGWLVINGRKVAPMPPTSDGQGRPLPTWREARVLGPDEFFVFSNRIPNSFDSRCYGPIRREQIDTVRWPLMVW